MVGGLTHYYISFTDGQAIQQELEISRIICAEFIRFIRAERNLRRSDERHKEQSDLTEITLHKRALNPQKSIEDTVIGNMQGEMLRQAIEGLPETQRRRFVLHHECGFTYEQIADVEGCSFQAVGKAVKAAETAIKNFFESQG